MTKVKLNLGCGSDVKDGWQNYDMFPIDDRVKTINLNNIPFKFKDDSVDYILISHVFEHLMINRLDFLLEIERVLKPGGIIEIKVPYSHPNIDHTMWFIPRTYFDNIEKYCNLKKIFFKHNKGDKYSFLFRAFPFMEKLFPLMSSGELVWKLQKK